MVTTDGTEHDSVDCQNFQSSTIGNILASLDHGYLPFVGFDKFSILNQEQLVKPISDLT